MPESDGAVPPPGQAALRAQYDGVRESYERLAINVQQAVRGFLAERKIVALDVSYRIKTFESFCEKVARKKYTVPMEQCEDFCGLRVICYYLSDAMAVEKILREEFSIRFGEDTSHRLGEREFGYRSIHLIVSIKDSWVAAPNYRGLSALKVEIQVRTVLMHAWAEIEHKIGYKSDTQAPPGVRRQLSWLSAKLEEADEQFESIRDRVSSYRAELARTVSEREHFDSTLDLNSETLRALLAFYFPERQAPPDWQIGSLVDQFNRSGVTIADMVRAVELTRDHLAEFAKTLMDVGRLPREGWAQVGYLKAALDLSVQGYAASRGAFDASDPPSSEVFTQFMTKIKQFRIIPPPTTAFTSPVNTYIRLTLSSADPGESRIGRVLQHLDAIGFKADQASGDPEATGGVTYGIWGFTNTPVDRAVVTQIAEREGMSLRDFITSES